MATTTRVLDANVNGTVYTSNANDALEALDTCHSGATAPTDEVANGKLWLDTSTTPGVLKVYNNAAWVAVASGSTPAELLTDIKTVDGAGSGLDADLLDGSHASDFYLASNPSGYTTNVGSITGVTAGSGMTGGGTTGAVTLTHADTSAQASVNNTGRTYIQDVTLDGFGHVTGLVSNTVDAVSIGVTLLGSPSASGTTFSITGLDLSSYTFLRVAIDGVSHNASFVDREIVFGGISMQIGDSGESGNGVVDIHLASSFAFTHLIPLVGSITSLTFASSITNATTSLTFSLNGSGSFDAGTVYVYGIK